MNPDIIAPFDGGKFFLFCSLFHQRAKQAEKQPIQKQSELPALSDMPKFMDIGAEQNREIRIVGKFNRIGDRTVSRLLFPFDPGNLPDGN